MRAKEVALGALDERRRRRSRRWRRACDLWCARWFWRDGRPPSAAELRDACDAIFGRGSTLNSTHVRTLDCRRPAGRHGQRLFSLAARVRRRLLRRARPPARAAGLRRGDRQSAMGNAPPRSEARRRPLARQRPALSSFIRESGLYPSCDRGHMNLYQPFLERALTSRAARRTRRPRAAVGPATDDGAAELRRRLFERSRVDTIVGLDNARRLFPIHRGLRFAVVVVEPRRARPARVAARFGVRTTEELAALPDVDGAIESCVSGAADDAGARRDVGAGDARCPMRGVAIDLDLLKRLAREFPRLGAIARLGARVRPRAERDRRSRRVRPRRDCRSSTASISRRSWWTSARRRRITSRHGGSPASARRRFERPRLALSRRLGRRQRTRAHRRDRAGRRGHDAHGVLPANTRSRSSSSTSCARASTATCSTPSCVC